MGNSRAKGKRRERWAGELYERAGYEEFRPEESQYGPTDIYGLFDLLALGHGQPRLAQVRSEAKGMGPHFEEAHERFPHALVHFDYLVVYPGHGGPHPTPRRWRLFHHDGEGGYNELVDERDDDWEADGEGVVSVLRG